MADFSKLTTESYNPRTAEIDKMSALEIAKIINRTSSAVKMRLQKGRRLLEKIYREEYL